MAIQGRPNTIRTKTSLLKNHIAGKLNTDGSNLDEMVAEWQANLMPATVKSLLYLAKDTVRDASGVELDIRSHISRVGRSSQQKMVRALNKAEIVKLGAVIKADYKKIYIPFMICVHTGMRRGECWGLKLEDVDILNDRITIQRSYCGPTKSGKPRVIPISFALEKILLAETVISSYNKARDQRKQNLIPFVFDPNPMLRRAAAKAGLREPQSLTWHSLRHSFATLALESGISPRLVSKALGHASVGTTLSIYWASTGESIDLSFLPDK